MKPNLIRRLIANMDRYPIWQSQIKLNGKRFYLGVFDREEDAANAYKSARLKYHPFAPTEKSL